MSHTDELGDCVTSSHRREHCSLINQAHVLLLKRHSLKVDQTAAENSPREFLFLLLSEQHLVKITALSCYGKGLFF